MFKLVVLFSVLALSAAKPGWVTPVTYSSVVPAVSSVSQYRNDVYHGLPSVYSGYSPVAYGYGVPAVTTYSQGYNSPAVVLDAVHGVPLDTPAVVAARAAHYQAKAFANAGIHTIAKRSVVGPLTYTSVLSPVSAPYTHVASAAPVTPFVRNTYTPVAYSSPFASAYTVPAYGYSAVAPNAFSVHPWK